jgi:hypothetical protein
MTQRDLINEVVEICCANKTPKEKEFIIKALCVINKIKYEKK